MEGNQGNCNLESMKSRRLWHVCFYWSASGEVEIFSENFWLPNRLVHLFGDGLWIARSQKFLTNLHPGSFTSPKFHHLKKVPPDHLPTINFQGQTRCWTSGGNQCILRIVPKCLLSCTRWWFQNCFIFTPTWEMIPNLTISYFSNGLVKNHQLVVDSPPFSRVAWLLCFLFFSLVASPFRPWQFWCDDRKQWCIVTYHGIMNGDLPKKRFKDHPQIWIHFHQKNKTQNTTYPERQNPERFSFLISSERTD